MKLIKQKYFLILAAVLLIGPLSGCGNEADETDKTATQESLYEVYTSQYTLSSGYTMNIFQVSGMKDKELEDKVNESLNSYLYTLVEPWFLPENLEEYEPIIHCQTDRYLSVEYSFEYTAPIYISWPSWHYCITVDMQSGEVVFFDDLIDINEDFASKLKYNSIVKTECRGGLHTDEEEAEWANERYSKWRVRSICSAFNHFTRDYLYGDYYRENGYDKYAYSTSIYMNVFYLEEGKICFARPYASYYTIDWLMLDDIEDFLKVPKW